MKLKIQKENVSYKQSSGDWLWKPANIKVENNGAVVYVGSSLTVHKIALICFCFVLFFSQFVTEYINAMFLFVISNFKMIGMLLNVVHGQV